jgi:asparagine synthase (glutamine-hydrolysing)
MVINGMWGETSATSRHYALPLRTKVGRALRDLRARWAGHRVAHPVGPAFHARLAPHRLQALAGEIDDALGAAVVSEAPSERGGSETIGYLPAAYKCLHQPNEFYAGAARMESIFRDMRLLRLFASFPRDMLRRDLADRGLARAMLDGGLPDAIRLRTDKGPAFPDNLQRMRREAPDARLRLPLFRSAELDDWLDLDWLDQQLGIIAAHGPANERHSVTVQTTAIAAEFLLWWRSNG